MLAEAHRRCSRGEDVVVGFVETHGRKETAELVEGLERLPLKQHHLPRQGVRGARHRRGDRAPARVGARRRAGAHQRPRRAPREALAERGGDPGGRASTSSRRSTSSTSRASTTPCTTSPASACRRPLPDAVLDQADEVVLVDLTTAALLNRLRRGVVYDLDKIPGALANFFKRENLVALRELALRKTAEEVDEFLERITAGRGGAAPLGRRRADPGLHPAQPCGRQAHPRGHRLAKRFQGRLLGAARADARADRWRGQAPGGAAVRARRGAGRRGRRGGGRLGRRGDPPVRPRPSRDLHRRSASPGGRGWTRSSAARGSPRSSARSTTSTSWSSPIRASRLPSRGD